MQQLGRGEFFWGVESHQFFVASGITTRFCEEVVELDAKMYGNFDVFGFFLFWKPKINRSNKKTRKTNLSRTSQDLEIAGGLKRSVYSTTSKPAKSRIQFGWKRIFCFKLKKVPSGKLACQWKTTIFNMRYIFKWWIFHCYVGLPEGNPKKFNTKKLWQPKVGWETPGSRSALFAPCFASTGSLGAFQRSQKMTSWGDRLVGDDGQ